MPCAWFTGYTGPAGLFRPAQAVQHSPIRPAGRPGCGRIRHYLDHAYFARADRVNRLLARVLPVHRASNMIIVAARRR